MSTSDPNIERAMARVGTWLRGKWYLDRLIGVGGMAAVYAATHRNGKRGAVKLLHPTLSSDANVRGRFLREGYVANKVGHTGAVSVLDDDLNEDGTVFLVMELLEGRTAEAIATSQPDGRMPVDDALALADGLCDVLAAAHAQGILHRDIKPENLFVTKDGSVRILDFGIARLHDADPSSRGTQTGEVFGTPAFMPPEQALGEHGRMDARSDLWAVGATLWNLLTGKLVHEADTAQKVMLAAMTKPAPPFASERPDLPAEIALVIDRALAFDPRDRWPDAHAMQRAVRAARASYVANRTAAPTLVSGATSRSHGGQHTVAPVSSEPPTLRIAPRRSGLFVGAAFALVAAASLAFVAIRFVTGSPGGESGSGERTPVAPSSDDPPKALSASADMPAPASASGATSTPIAVVPAATPMPVSAGSPMSSASAKAPAPRPSTTATTTATTAATATTTATLTPSNPFDRRQ